MRILITLLWTVVAVFSGSAQNIDINLLKQINLNRNRSLDPAFKGITNSVTPMIVAVPAGFLAAALIKKDSSSKSAAIIVSSSQIIAGVITTSLKYAINRKRPGDTYSFIDPVVAEGSPSFPSGHTSSAFALATSVSIVCPKWYIIAPSFLWASSVAYSRLDLGVHYPSDVLAGAILGSGSAYLSCKLNQWLLKHRSGASRHSSHR